MAKFKKFISIIALAVFSLTFLVGCGLFVLNEDRYRDQHAITVGNEQIKLGEVIDYFDSNGTAYLQQGYGYQQVWDMMFPVFIQQKVMLNEYKTTFAGNKNTSDLAKEIGGNAEYLDDTTLEYIQKSVFLSFYSSLDSLTMSELKSDFTFKDEVSNDKYPEMIQHEDGYTPADADRTLDIEGLDKELEEYPADQDYKTVKYVFAQTDAKVAEIVADLNGRLAKDNDEDAELTVAEYIKAQNKAISTITKNVKNNKKVDLETYLKDTLNAQVDAQIANDYLAKEVYKANIQSEITQQVFENRLAEKIAQATEVYTQNPMSFASFITGLKDSDFVHYIPEEYKDEYYYVRSILLPFSNEQTEWLNAAKTRLGANSPEYKAYRDSLVKDLKVKDNEGNEGIAVDTVKSEITSRDAFISATYKYNTDAGMQNPVHSYVVSKNPTDLSYGGTSFVREFVDAARKMIANDDEWTECVTDYGIHLIWNDGKVAKDEIKWEERNNYGTEGGSASWRFYQEIYTELKTLFADKQIATLYNSYKQGGKITINTDVISAYTDSIGVEYKDKLKQKTSR
ncbi:MAG: hypothetical protein IKV34_00500 [Clostridia bacterium]|nr:hypothetical protein [Clostridia bacterium]